MSTMREHLPGALARGRVIGTTVTLILLVAGAASAQENARGKGKIFVSGVMHAFGAGEAVASGIFAVDPEKKTWTRPVELPDDVLKGRHFRVSPDGTKLAYVMNELAGDEVGKAGTIIVKYARPVSTWMIDLREKSPPQKLGEIAGMPIWSVDGKELLIRKADRPNNIWRYETWRTSADGSNPRMLPIPATDEITDWSPDRTWVVGTSSRHTKDGVRHQIYRMRLDGTDQRRLSDADNNLFPRISPDGRYIAYVSMGPKNANCGIDVMTSDGKDRRRVCDDTALGSPESVCWSPDGRHLATILKFKNRPLRSQEPRLCIISVDNKAIEVLPLLDLDDLDRPDWR